MAPTTAESDCCSATASTGRERVRYFPRQMLTADDLGQEQEYLRTRLRRHNRLLHGWGVVCGCEVTAGDRDWTVRIAPGYVLTPEGEEVVIESAVEIDVSRQGLDGNAAVACGGDEDPWCSSVRVDRRVGQELYVAVAYAECPTRPVRVQPVGCGCDGTACEYSRVRDSFVARVLTQLPASYADVANPPASNVCPTTGVRPCPPCLTDRWVVLARITPLAPTIQVSDIDNHSHRRYVATTANTWIHCRPPADRAESAKNLKQILTALHEYHDAFGHFPTDVRTAEGNALLSWRVLILPFLKKNDLFLKFKLDEPWNSEQNQSLIPFMPTVLRSPRQESTLKNRTTYLAPLGKGLMWEDPNGLKLSQITDGASNTIALVEADDDASVIWSKPEDVTIDPKHPAAGLLGHYEEGFQAAMADGSVRFFNKSIDPNKLWAMFTYAGGEAVDPP